MFANQKDQQKINRLPTAIPVQVHFFGSSSVPELAMSRKASSGINKKSKYQPSQKQRLKKTLC